MFQKLTLRGRIFFISSGLILLAVALIWLFVRPEYKRTIISERTTIVSQLQEYTLRQTDNTINNWLNSVNRLAEDLVLSPGETESLVSKAVNYTPGLMRILITDIKTKQNIDIVRSIYQNVDFETIVPNWRPSRIDEQVSISWITDDSQSVDFFIAQHAIQIDGDVYTLDMYFDSQRLNENLIKIPLGGNYVANIVSADGENIVPNNTFSFPKELAGEASYSKEKVMPLGGKNWFVLSSRFETIPFWHVIAVEDSFILEPVNQLVRFSLIAAGSVLILMLIFSWYVSDRINRPVKSLLADVDHLAKLDFEHTINTVSLPEFQTMHDTLENIRLTLKRYRKLNVEKIILEEWKNRYMVTYSDDLIGVINEHQKFSFANNQLTQFLESLKINPTESTITEVFNHPNLKLSKSNQSFHYPDPFTVKVEQAELVHMHTNGNTYYYDCQHLSILDESKTQKGAYLIIHDKTEDRLLDIKRNDMINVIVHELKNPITGVVGLTKLIIDNQSMSKEEVTVLLKEVFASGERMNELVNRFLEVQKLEAGQTNLDFTSVDILQVVNDVKMVSNSLLTNKKMKANISSIGKNFSILANKELVFDAVQNLVSNAVKYGDPARTIQIDVISTASNVSVSVTDYGFGISVEDQKKVFDKFFRVKSNAKAANEKGTGLGLAYVKEIMTRHNGDITLESNSEIGSKFTIIFPKKR